MSQALQITRARRKNPMMGLTPLIDMIFLLLLFFLLGSDFVSYGQSRLAPPRGTGGSESASQPAIVTLSEAGKLHWNGAPVSSEKLAQDVAALVARHDDQLVVLMPAGAAEVQKISDTLDLLVEAGAASITLERDVFDIDLADF
ncbi:MAG: biopolymer transporter ExbD [Alphaproteobacteria bacterium]|jgi:biopolymer transport protein ExbD|nr:biopolymer transporter ExbD [Alphaproteobacteria bacterium]